MALSCLSRCAGSTVPVRVEPAGIGGSQKETTLGRLRSMFAIAGAPAFMNDLQRHSSAAVLCAADAFVDTATRHPPLWDSRRLFGGMEPVREKHGATSTASVLGCGVVPQLRR